VVKSIYVTAVTIIIRHIQTFTNNSGKTKEGEESMVVFTVPNN